jgi:hypothetical protein
MPLQNYKTKYEIYQKPFPYIENRYLPELDKYGTYFGVEFKNGYALLDLREVDNDQAYDILQKFGRDGRFEIVELTTTSP